MDTVNIINLLKSEKDFIGVYPVDLLPTFVNVPCTLVVNLDPHYKDGSHWTAIEINASRQAHYFDSFGRSPECNVLTFIERNASRGYTYNKNKIQDNLSSACGYFCILFVLMRNEKRKFYRLMKRCKHLENEIKTYIMLKKLFNQKMAKHI